MTVYCDSLEGMWGPVTDPGIFQFTNRIAAEGFNVDGSPYRDFAVDTVVERIKARPKDSINLLTGTSLGCNNIAVVAAYVYMLDPTIVIHGMWGFQASIWGAKAQAGTDYTGIPPNVKFAHLAYSTNPLNGGLGAYVWQKTAGNTITNLYAFDTYDLHPGDTNPAVTAMFLAEMHRVSAAVQSNDRGRVAALSES